MIYTAENTCLIGKFLEVYVDGKEIDEVVMVDTDKNLVEYALIPVRVDDSGKRIYTETITGKITLMWIEK